MADAEGVKGNAGATNRWSNLARSCAVEFIGDLLFIFIGSLQAASGGGVTAAALTHGVAIAVFIAAMGHISGGHFNPAVTTGVVLSGAMPIVNAICYIFSQLLGGFVGALLVRAVTHGDLYNTVIRGGVTVPAADTYFLEGTVGEAIGTYVLVSTVLLTAVDTSSNLLAPLAIGLSITVDIFALGPITGGSVNPARSLGPALAFSLLGNSNSHWNMHHIYWIGQIIGAVVAAGLYRLFLGNENKRLVLK